ncbi:hypothetical protein J2129_002016 [Methanofollis sp. W23]|uniref:hypothetical protein n=1 Tax=Methanofollis sp. W23 TaxID=2817849 RepID=UPI001AE371EF|nr:hypothetical protein [Methanofollis sp. W23]MBP2146562.1 hypothetical protein [Methanofollis sp. W23]
MIEVSRTRCLFIFLGLLIICMTATAGEGPQISVEADTAWLIAGDPGEAVVTATVTNGSNPQAGAEVVFSCDPARGSFSRTTLATDAEGKAVTRFIPGTKSGDVVVSAVWGEGDGSVSDECEVGIDHAAPYRIQSIECNDEVTAGSTTEITLSMEDEYGNLIDDRRSAENVTFYVGSPDDGAHFGGGEKEITVQVDGSGEVRAPLTTDTVAGENIVYIALPGAVKDRYLTILGIGEPIPYTLNAVVDPDERWVPANGEGVFVITYFVQDRYGNPCNGTAIVVNTSLEKEEDRTIHTNRAGRAAISYGPKDSVGEVTITAKTLENESLSDTQVVEFTSTEPVQMVLSAYPQMMPSGDVPNAKPAQVMAKVMDAKGNPVEGETVTFTIKSHYGDTQVELPQWEGTEEDTTTANTDERGYAVAPLWPGSFTGNGYPTAHAGCWVEAVWNSYQEPLNLNWTNVPYLSVITNVTPPKAAWNETVEVNITLIGNGYKLEPKKVNAVICTDRSGSMLHNDPDRMHSVREAGKEFVASVDEGDKVGLVTFGRNTGNYNQIDEPGESSFRDPESYTDNWYDVPKQYLDYATVDLALTEDHSLVKAELDSIVPDSGTPLRYGLYRAIKELSGEGNSEVDPGAIKAAILLSDGDYNWYGDPLARGDPDGYWREYWVWDSFLKGHYEKVWVPIDNPEDYGDLMRGYYSFTDLSDAEQNLSVYARNNGVLIYAIGYDDDLSSDGTGTLKRLAESTAVNIDEEILTGRYYSGTAANIEEIYRSIAGELREEAGVNTTLALDFKDVTVSTNTSEWTVPGNEAFSYVPSTREDKVWFNGDGVEGYPKTYDDRENWSKGELYFNVGTIKLNQTWQTTFHLKVLPNPDAIGNVKILDNNSVLTFNDGKDDLKIPNTYLTVMRALNNTPLGNASLDLQDLEVTGVTRQNLDLAWTLNYTGNSTVTETIEYRSEHGSWAQAGTRTAGKGEKREEARLDIRDLPLTLYDIRVVADTEDAGSRYCITDADLRKLLNEKTYIKME